MTLKVVLSTTCRGRVEHIRQTLSQNLRDISSDTNSAILILDYNDQDGLASYIKQNHKADLESGRVVYYHTDIPSRFHMANAKNLAHRLAIHEGANVLVTLDADNFAGEGFVGFIRKQLGQSPNAFLCPQVVALGTCQVRIAPRGVAGRLAIRTQDFIKAGGYDEKYDTWRGEDVDLVARLRRMGYSPRFIAPVFLNAVRHGNDVRFKEYPHAEKYQNDDEVRQINAATHSIVNFGTFGCGSVQRNFTSEHVTLRPVPTRIFGIGMHKTATTSLNAAFKELGLSSFHWDTGDKARDIWDQMNKFGKSWQLERYYALSDLPIPLLFKQLDKSYPESKFILTLRNETDWLRSVERLWDPRFNPTRWEWDVYPFSNRIHTALYGRRDFNAEVFLARYRKHNAEVLDYFKSHPQDLLVMDMSNGAGWKELCKFLEMPVPKTPFPHLYKSSPQLSGDKK